MAVERPDTTWAVGEIAGDVNITGKSKRFKCLWKSFDDAANADEAAGFEAQHS